MPENMESLTMKMAQVGQIIDQYRVEIYNSELRMNLMIKILEEKGIMVKDEFTKRWPQYLKNDVGVAGPDGIMEGSMRTIFYGEK